MKDELYDLHKRMNAPNKTNDIELVEASLSEVCIDGDSSTAREEDKEDAEPIRNTQPQSAVIDDARQRYNIPNDRMYEHWSSEGDTSLSSSGTSNRKITSAEIGDELAWRIIRIVIKGWCLIWMIFAVLVIAAEIFAPRHNNSTISKSERMKHIVTVEDEQLFLEISENIVSACQYSKFDTEDGRQTCQELCHNHSCCFIEDENDEFQSHRYSCANDPEKMCAAYAGCKSLVVSEDDALYDADGADTLGVGDVIDETNDTQIQSTVPNAAISGANYTLTPELQLIQQVITSVCSNENLHTRKGVLECASLCNPSMCCFNQTEIHSVNPKLELILKMEGIDTLDLSSMGTCMNEEAWNATALTSTTQSHFCQVHTGCKSILLLGAQGSSTATSKTRSHSYYGDSLIFTNVGVYDKKNNNIATTSSISSEQEERSIVTVFILFGLIIGASVYLLVFKRNDPIIPLRNIGMDTSNNDPGQQQEEMVDFVL